MNSLSPSSSSASQKIFFPKPQEERTEGLENFPHAVAVALDEWIKENPDLEKWVNYEQLDGEVRKCYEELHNPFSLPEKVVGQKALPSNMQKILVGRLLNAIKEAPAMSSFFSSAVFLQLPLKKALVLLAFQLVQEEMRAHPFDNHYMFGESNRADDCYPHPAAVETFQALAKLFIWLCDDTGSAEDQTERWVKSASKYWKKSDVDLLNKIILLKKQSACQEQLINEWVPSSDTEPLPAIFANQLLDWQRLSLKAFSPLFEWLEKGIVQHRDVWQLGLEAVELLEDDWDLAVERTKNIYPVVAKCLSQVVYSFKGRYTQAQQLCESNSDDYWKRRVGLLLDASPIFVAKNRELVNETERWFHRYQQWLARQFYYFEQPAKLLPERLYPLVKIFGFEVNHLVDLFDWANAIEKDHSDLTSSLEFEKWLVATLKIHPGTPQDNLKKRFSIPSKKLRQKLIKEVFQKWQKNFETAEQQLQNLGLDREGKIIPLSIDKTDVIQAVNESPKIAAGRIEKYQEGSLNSRIERAIQDVMKEAFCPIGLKRKLLLAKQHYCSPAKDCHLPDKTQQIADRSHHVMGLAAASKQWMEVIFTFWSQLLTTTLGRDLPKKENALQWMLSEQILTSPQSSRSSSFWDPARDLLEHASGHLEYDYHQLTTVWLTELAHHATERGHFHLLRTLIPSWLNHRSLTEEQHLVSQIAKNRVALHLHHNLKKLAQEAQQTYRSEEYDGGTLTFRYTYGLHSASHTQLKVQSKMIEWFEQKNDQNARQKFSTLLNNTFVPGQSLVKGKGAIESSPHPQCDALHHYIADLDVLLNRLNKPFEWVSGERQERAFKDMVVHITHFRNGVELLSRFSQERYISLLINLLLITQQYVTEHLGTLLLLKDGEPMPTQIHRLKIYDERLRFSKRLPHNLRGWIDYIDLVKGSDYPMSKRHPPKGVQLIRRGFEKARQAANQGEAEEVTLLQKELFTLAQSGTEYLCHLLEQVALT